MCGTNIITCIWIQVGSSCQSAAATILASFLQQQQLCSSQDWGDGGKSKPSLSLMSVILTWAWPGSCSVRRGRDDRMIRWHDRMDVCHNHQIIRSSPSCFISSWVWLGLYAPLPSTTPRQWQFPPPIKHPLWFHWSCLSPAERQQLGNPARPSPVLWVCLCVLILPLQISQISLTNSI